MKNKSIRSELMKHLYPAPSEYKDLHFEIFPLVFLTGYLIHQTNFYTHKMSIQQKIMGNEEILQYLPKGVRDFMSWRVDRTHDRRGLNPNGFHACETLIKMLGGPNLPAHGVQKVRVELLNFLKSEIEKVKRNPFGRWSKSNYMPIGRMSFICSVGAIALIEFKNSEQSLQTDIWDYINEVYSNIKKMPVLNYKQITHSIFNGVHENQWYKETASNTEIAFLLSFSNDYISLIAKETGLTTSNIASMILKGMSTPLSPKEKLEKEKSKKSFLQNGNQGLLFDLMKI